MSYDIIYLIIKYYVFLVYRVVLITRYPLLFTLLTYISIHDLRIEI